MEIIRNLIVEEHFGLERGLVFNLENIRVFRWKYFLTPPENNCPSGKLTNLRRDSNFFFSLSIFNLNLG